MDFFREGNTRTCFETLRSVREINISHGFRFCVHFFREAIAWHLVLVRACVGDFELHVEITRF